MKPRAAVFGISWFNKFKTELIRIKFADVDMEEPGIWSGQRRLGLDLQLGSDYVWVGSLGYLASNSTG